MGDEDSITLNSLHSLAAYGDSDSVAAENFQAPYNLILDLDQTLIHTSPDIKLNNHCLSLKIPANDPNASIWHCNIRSYVKEFIEQMLMHFNVYFFTKATRSYAEAIVPHLNASIPMTHVCAKEDQLRAATSLKLPDLKEIDRVRKSKKIMNEFLGKPQFRINNTFILDDRIDMWEDEDHVNVIPVPAYFCHNDLIDNYFFHLTKTITDLIAKSLTSDNLVKELYLSKNELLKGCKFYFLDEFKVELACRPYFWDFRHLTEAVIRLGASVSLELTHHVTHIIYLGDNPKVVLPHELYLVCPCPYIIHWSWLLHTIYFHQVAPVAWFSQNLEGHAVSLFVDYKSSYFTAKIPNSTPSKIIVEYQTIKKL